MNIDILNVEYDDCQQIAAIEKKCFSDNWNTSDFGHYVTDNHSKILKACNNLTKEIYGYICGKSVIDTMEIHNFAVHPATRRKGIGNLLIQYVCHHAKKDGIKKIFLDVRQSNIAAINLKKKNRFNQISIRKNYYKDPLENAVVMEWISM